MGLPEEREAAAKGRAHRQRFGQQPPGLWWDGVVAVPVSLWSADGFGPRAEHPALSLDHPSSQEMGRRSQKICFVCLGSLPHPCRARVTLMGSSPSRGHVQVHQPMAEKTFFLAFYLAVLLKSFN